MPRWKGSRPGLALFTEELDERHVRRRVQVDEHEAFPDIERDFGQALVLAVEFVERLGVWHADEAPVEAVGPAVERAAEGLAVAMTFQHDLVAAMLADVVKGAQAVVLAAHDEDRHLERGDVLDEVVAGRTGLFDTTTHSQARL